MKNMKNMYLSRINTFSFSDNFIERLADHIEANYIKTGRAAELSRLAIVFGGRRPALFLKRELARRVGRAFASPKFFTIDEWMRTIVKKKEDFTSAEELNQSYELYKMARELTPEILENRETFAAFLPWAREILRFIDQLDIERVDNDKLTRVRENAQIGYPVPDDINCLLERIVFLREAMHRHMLETRTYARGFVYLRAAKNIEAIEVNEFDNVFFANFFYLNRCEQAVISSLYTRDKATLFMQGDERRWPVFKRTATLLDASIREGEEVCKPKFDLKLYQGFDVHSQVGIIKGILKGIKDPEDTVIVLPNSAHIIPLLSEIAGGVEEFNVSMGYPLMRSSLYSLLEFIFQSQLSRKGNEYYARDYLKVLRHPLVKNLKVHEKFSTTRILVHKIEEILTGLIMADISGSLFLSLDSVEACDALFDEALKTLAGMQIEVSKKELRDMLQVIHRVVCADWQDINDFERLAGTLRSFTKLFLEKSFLKKYPLNVKIAERLLGLCDEMEAAAFNKEQFSQEDLFKIFSAKVKREMVSFRGSPLKGLQILGLFETRSLNFTNVIVMDVNEGVLPHLNIYEALIPREVMVSLNLDRLEQEEEIQRYQFMRLISSARNVHLVYQETKDKMRSRFVEELVWDQERAAGKLGVVAAEPSGFTVEVVPIKQEVKKTKEMLAFLRGHTYSASSVDRYMRDPWEFYLNYVLGLREAEDLLDEPENRQVGTFIHELLEETFARFVGKKPVIDAKFRKYFQKTLDAKFADTFAKAMKSESFLVKSVIDERMSRFLDAEQERPVKEIMSLEQSFRDTINLSVGEVKFVYKLDRVDRMEDGSILLVDYKTGSVNPSPKGLDKLRNMDPSRENFLENVRSFQMPLYYHYLRKYYAKDEVAAAFYNLRTTELDYFKNYDPDSGAGVFLKALDFIIREILDPDVPFIK